MERLSVFIAAIVALAIALWLLAKVIPILVAALAAALGPLLLFAIIVLAFRTILFGWRR